jgi:hypothetical protein
MTSPVVSRVMMCRNYLQGQYGEGKMTRAVLVLV